MKRVSLAIISICMVLVLGTGCSQPINKTTTGAATGTALGAGLGAIIGDQTGSAGAGTAIGAAAGAITGALIGNQLDQVDDENAAVARRVELNQQTIDENRRLIEELKKRGADVRGTDRGVVINLPDVLFEFDRADLTPEARITVADISSVLRDANRNFSIEGHTDAVGTTTYNKKLSLNRAESVAQELERHGIPGEKMRVRGFGEGYPVATNNSDIGRARNRRVEVIVENF